jgi:hypothetical protein
LKNIKIIFVDCSNNQLGQGKVRITLISILFIFHCFNISSQIPSGQYAPSLKLAYNRSNGKVTGYFNDQTGYDEETKQSRFICKFYLEGDFNSNEIEIITYYPSDKTYVVKGTLVQLSPTEINIQLTEEHGGCGNVKHFSERPVRFELMDKSNWIEIRFVTNKRAYFYEKPTSEAPKKSYLTQDDILCIDQIEGNKAHCTYFGKTVSSGWVLLSDLNN